MAQTPKLHVCIGGLCSPIPMGTMQKGTVGYCIHSGNELQLKKSKLREARSFIIYYKQTYMISASEGETLFLLYWTVNKSAFCYRGRYYVYLPRLFAKHISSRTYFRTKVNCASAYETHRNTKETHGRIVTQLEGHNQHQVSKKINENLKCLNTNMSIEHVLFPYILLCFSFIFVCLYIIWVMT